MRKGQEKILEKAQTKNFPENVMELLKSEEYTLGTLQEIYVFFSCHRKELIEDTGVFFTVKDFCCEILNGSFCLYWFFERCTIENILQLQSEYEQSLYTRQEMIDINKLMHRAVSKLQEAKCIVEERRKFIHDKSPYDISNSIRHIYGKESLSKLTVPEKIRFEKYCVLNDIPLDEAEFLLKKYLMETRYPGLWDVCMKKEKNHAVCEKNYLWETEKIMGIKNILESLGENNLTAEISGSPYKITSSVSVTGISIRCDEYSKYIAIKRDDGSIDVNYENRCHSDEILMMFDGTCYIKGNGKWRPMTLKDFSILYNRNKTLAKIADIYMARHVNEGGLIWEDIKKDILGRTVPPVIVNKMRLCSNKTEMMTSNYKHADFFNWNKKDLFLGYVVMKTLPCVEKRDQNILLDFANKTERPDWYINLHSYKNLRKEMLVSLLMQKITEDSYWKNEEGETVSKEEVESLIKDYIEMSRQMKKKISLRYRSAKKIKDAHDAVIVEYQSRHTPKIEIPKTSRFLRLRKILPKEQFEWITSRRRIILEGENMHHCVASYAQSINQDKCAIYSFIYPMNQRRYTIEFREGAKGYYIAQVQGVCNSGCPEEVRGYIEEWL